MGVDVGASFFASALDSYKPHLQSLSNLKLDLKRLGCILNQFPDHTNGMKAPSLSPLPHTLSCCFSCLPHTYQNVPAIVLKTRIEM